ncbi:hypothetical protein Tsp_10173 [Trichinella spiralis]|uniref:hypothetical protein n=1 Tax=Trichinella spiralis TaxID=6334 RepID=UPI0001EFDBC9|nr:hypothetical protein Tsp_10173 [Trichinella spiralis]
MVCGPVGTFSSSPSSSSILCLCVIACCTYSADLFAQGLDLSGRTRNLHNILVGMPAAMQSDGSLQHASILAKIAPNSKQIFALSQLSNYLPLANATANVCSPHGGGTGDFPARIPYYICDPGIATERCGNR